MPGPLKGAEGRAVKEERLCTGTASGPPLLRPQGSEAGSGVSAVQEDTETHLKGHAELSSLQKQIGKTEELGEK